jgi:hypothetical protein
MLVNTNGFNVTRAIVENIKTVDRITYYDMVALMETINSLTNPILDCIVLKRGENGIIPMTKVSRLSQFDMTHVQNLNMWKKNYPDLSGYSIVRCKYNSNLDIVPSTYDELVKVCEIWDSEAEHYEAPTNDGIYCRIMGDISEHMKQVVDEQGTTLQQKIDYLSNVDTFPSNQRLTLYPEKGGVYLDFVIEKITEKGWTKMINGGLVYRLPDCTWTSHT